MEVVGIRYEEIVDKIDLKPGGASRLEGYKILAAKEGKEGSRAAELVIEGERVELLFNGDIPIEQVLYDHLVNIFTLQDEGES